MRRLQRLLFGALALLLLAPAVGAERAHFTVTSQVINPDLPAFTTTIGGLGNGAELMRGSGGFEPTEFRTRLTATRDASNTIHAEPNAVSGWDSWAEGAFDGAEIEVLRIVNGRMQTIRRDRVAPGGHRASGWIQMLPRDRILPAGTTVHLSTWAGFSRRDAPWYYTVRAVDARGRLSPPARAVSIFPPATPGKIEDKPAYASLTLTGAEAPRLAAPRNLTATLTVSRVLMLRWDPVPGAAGYVLYRSDLPPERHRGYGLDLAGRGPDLRRGDMVLMRKSFHAPRRAEVATHRAWNTNGVKAAFGTSLLPGMPGDRTMPEVRLVAHPADTPVADPGKTFLQAELHDGQVLQLSRYNHAGPGHSYYPLLDPGATYRFEVWLRGSGTVSARFGLGGVYRKIEGLPAVFHPGSEWRRFSVEFRVPPADQATPRRPGVMALRVSGSGTVDIDNFRVYRTDAGFMDLRPEDRRDLAASGMAALRMHMFIKTGRTSYDLGQLLNPPGVSAGTGGYSLPRLLEITRSLEMDPWLQIEPHFSAEEWLGLAEYLAAPFDPATDDPQARPWAARRVAQGQAAPWTDVFDRIYFEIGNETWNSLFAPWIFPTMTDGATGASYTAGEVYGLYQEHVLSILRQSPWWDRLAPHIEPVLGGWNGSAYGLDALARSPGSTVLTHAAYIGGWDSGEGPVRQTAEGFASVMAYAPHAMERATRRYQEDVRRLLPGRDVTLGTYESGPGYALNGLNGQKVSAERAEEQERVMKSAAAGAATLDSFLTRATAGDRLQNFFTFGHGNTWRSHARWESGGQAYPSWAWLALFNTESLGDLLAVRMREVPRMDLPKIARRSAVADAPMAAAYATRRGDRLSVVVISRRVPGVPPGSDAGLSVSIDLPIRSAARLTRYRQSGDYSAENYSSDQTRILAEPLAVPADPSRLEIAAMPPASAEIYIFDGVEFAP